MQTWWTFEERAALAARAFKVWKSLRNKVVLHVKRISYFLHFSLLYVVYIISNMSMYCWCFFSQHQTFENISNNVVFYWQQIRDAAWKGIRNTTKVCNVSMRALKALHRPWIALARVGQMSVEPRDWNVCPFLIFCSFNFIRAKKT